MPTFLPYISHPSQMTTHYKPWVSVRALRLLEIPHTAAFPHAKFQAVKVEKGLISTCSSKSFLSIAMDNSSPIWGLWSPYLSPQIIRNTSRIAKIFLTCFQMVTVKCWWAKSLLHSRLSLQVCFLHPKGTQVAHLRS